MANVNRPNGFTPIGTLSGSAWQANIQAFQLDGSHAAIAVGDLVEMTADGYLDVLTAGATDNGVIGLCVGIVPANATTVNGKIGSHFLSSTTPTLSGAGARYSAANATDIILVCTAPDLLMVGQEDGDTTPLTLAAVGAAVDIINGGVNATTGNSGMEIDSDSVGNTATDPLKIVGLYQSPENELASVDATKPWTKWVVTFNTHHFRDAGGI